MWEKIKRWLGLKERFAVFKDPFGNFIISYPEGWRYDEDIAVVEGSYGVWFEKGSKRISVHVTACRLADFDSYAQRYLKDPKRGVVGRIRKTTFKDMPAYDFRYKLHEGSKVFLGGALMFYTGRCIFYISWFVPKSEWPHFKELFKHILRTMWVRV